ncbi:MAG: hypothetical protein J3K34DRAFT_196403 [Monoraphidium minutum]|nr:MAG: hypothetical protein J3K34DRAFT_196403 [Monoraphidium minutum]
MPAAADGRVRAAAAHVRGFMCATHCDSVTVRPPTHTPQPRHGPGARHRAALLCVGYSIRSSRHTSNVAGSGRCQGRRAVLEKKGWWTCRVSAAGLSGRGACRAVRPAGRRGPGVEFLEQMMGCGCLRDVLCTSLCPKEAGAEGQTFERTRSNGGGQIKRGARHAAGPSRLIDTRHQWRGMRLCANAVMRRGAHPLDPHSSLGGPP